MSSFLKLSLVLSLFSWNTILEPPIKKTWKDLADVKFVRKYIKSEQSYFEIPRFSPNILELKGKTVQLSGYFIQIDEKLAVISALPMASCFFCGAAGPETLAEVQFAKKTKRYKTDQRLTIQGTFRTNDDNFDHLNYIFENAEVVE